MPDYIPQKDSKLVAWSDNFYHTVSDNATKWEIPADEIAALKTADAAFAAVYLQADSPIRDSIIVKEKNAARKALVDKIREMTRFRLQNPVITEADRTRLGITVRDVDPTNIPVPGTRPNLDIRVIDFRRLEIQFHDMDSESKAKPYGVNGAVINYALLDTPPDSTDALAHSVLATRTPHILEFTEAERGKTVYIAMRWQNEKGQKGPWSEIESAIVP
jgi:hypothetical protein